MKIKIFQFYWSDKNRFICFITPTWVICEIDILFSGHLLLMFEQHKHDVIDDCL